eukprot:SAG11_NODE_16308_length_551_cov_0.909292_1_plen_164_part_01
MLQSAQGALVFVAAVMALQVAWVSTGVQRPDELFVRGSVDKIATPPQFACDAARTLFNTTAMMAQPWESETEDGQVFKFSLCGNLAPADVPNLCGNAVASPTSVVRYSSYSEDAGCAAIGDGVWDWTTSDGTVATNVRTGSDVSNFTIIFRCSSHWGMGLPDLV